MGSRVSFRGWVRRSRNVLTLFAALTLVLVGSLSWLGLRLYRQDRELTRQRIQGQLEEGAEIVASMISSAVSRWGKRLEALGRAPLSEVPQLFRQNPVGGEVDGFEVVIEGGRVLWQPPAVVAYPPVTREAVQPAGQWFRQGELMEFTYLDYQGAEAIYRQLSTAPDSVIRAGALMRSARCQRKAGNRLQALRRYEALTRMGKIPVEGVPARLLGLYGQCTILEEMGRKPELREKVAELMRYLQEGGTSIRWSTFSFYMNEAERMLRAAGDGGDDPLSGETRWMAQRTPAFRNSIALDRLWRDWRSNPPDINSVSSGFRILEVEEEKLVLNWWATRDRLAVVVGEIASAGKWWLPQLAPLLEERGLAVVVTDVSGGPVLGEVPRDAEFVALKPPAQTGLPWNLYVVKSDPSRMFTVLEEQGRLLLAGMLLVVLLVLLTGYSLTRSVIREQKVARLQSDFVSAVSHEFRSPLTAIRQLLEMIASDRVLNKKQRSQYLTVIEQESRRLHRLVEDLLDFRRMEAGIREFVMRPVDIAAMVQEVTELFRDQVASAGQEIRLDLRTRDVPVRGDREALGRALWNLLDNAVKYSPTVQPIDVVLQQSDGEIAIGVTDRGPGIAKEEQETIFDKFVRGESAARTSRKGTGLGLAMVRRIVVAHRGRVELESRPGAGSTFAIVLPLLW